MKTKESTLKIEQHLKQINLNITQISRYNIILEILWLKTHNPYIDWRTEEMQFAETPKSGIRPEGQPERQNQLEDIKIQKISGEVLKHIWQQGEQVGMLYICSREVREVGTLIKKQKTARPSIQKMENIPKEY